MDESDNRRDVPASRSTLKLKSPARPAAPKSTLPKSTLPTSAAPKSAPRSKEPSTWADEHKQRMQADMDALGSGMMPAGDRKRSSK